MDLTKNKFFLLFTAFTTGACVMSLEMTASRVLAPSFGSSIYVWGSLIGMIMAALAVGYYLGGYLADKRKDIRILFKSLMTAALLVSLIPVIGDLVAKISTLGGMIYGPMISTLILFCVPMTILAMTSPMVIKFSTDELSDLGISAGMVYSISTAGSIAGTFLTAFVMIPNLGSTATILATAAVIMIISLAGIPKARYIAAVVFLLPGMIYHGLPDKDLVYSTESEYNIIKVYDYPDYNGLKLNYDYAIQSRVNKREILTGGYWDYFNMGPLLTKTGRILWIGMCVGASPRQLAHFYNATIDAVEIDPKVVEVAERYFNLTETEKIRIHVSDGRQYLRKTGQYDIINVDVFGNGMDIPFHLSTREFFSEAKTHMTDDGLLMMNAIAAKNDERVSDALAYTMKQVFPSVFIVNVEGNRILLAFKQTKNLQDVKDSVKDYDPMLEATANNTIHNIREFNSDSGIILTDDKSRMDELTFNMMRRMYEVRY